MILKTDMFIFAQVQLAAADVTEPAVTATPVRYRTDGNPLYLNRFYSGGFWWSLYPNTFSICVVIQNPVCKQFSLSVFYIAGSNRAWGLHDPKHNLGLRHLEKGFSR